ncbi:MAG TPA: ATP-binding protein [Planctomycetota bacterium]|nr:ATP-binding protein [Planctomycetota bacterium]
MKEEERVPPDEGSAVERRASLIRCVGDFLRRRQTDILRVWEEAVRQLPKARELDRPRLIDHVPELLNRIADYVEQARQTHADGEFRDRSPEQHAVARLDEGYDLSEVIVEYGVLRRAIFELLGKERQELSQPEELRVLNMALDEAVNAAVNRYAVARHGTLEALDRVAAFALSSGDPDECLPRILAVVLETTEAVDTVAILLVEEGHLRRRAAVGLDVGELVARIGAGFAGKIAATGKPLLLRGDEIQSVAASAGLKTRGLRVLYGAPLVHDGKVIGVAHMGSRTAVDFSEQDKLILRSMASRATALLVHHASREALRRSEERLRLASEATGLATWDWNLVTGELHWSERARGLFGAGLAPGETPSLERSFDAIHPEDRERVERALEAALDPAGSGVFSVEARVVRPDGTVRWFTSKGQTVFEGPERRAERMTGAALDVTDRKEAEAALHRALRARDEFVAVLSHDLRNPIGAIILGATLLHDQIPTEKVRLRKRADTVRRTAERASRMIDDLLEEIALTAGMVRLAKTPVSAQSLLDEVLETFQPGAEEREISMRAEVAPGLGTVSCDRDYVHRVFGNLVGNAKKFTPAGGTIVLGAEPAPGAVRFSVSDSGPGIPVEQQSRLFERGFRGAAVGSGLGLGLAIARGIVEAHGGKIGVESMPGKGATFWFTLPLG